MAHLMSKFLSGILLFLGLTYSVNAQGIIANGQVVQSEQNSVAVVGQSNLIGLNSQYLFRGIDESGQPIVELVAVVDDGTVYFLANQQINTSQISFLTGELLNPATSAQVI